MTILNNHRPRRGSRRLATILMLTFICGGWLPQTSAGQDARGGAGTRRYSEPRYVPPPRSAMRRAQFEKEVKPPAAADVAPAEDDETNEPERLPAPGQLLAPTNRIKIPLSRQTPGDDIRITNQNGMISLVVRDALLKDVLAGIAETQKLNIVCGDGTEQRVSLTLDQVRLEDALTAVVSVAGYTWTRVDRIIYVTSIGNSLNVSPESQGRRVEVFHLDYAAAEDLEQSIRNILSPAGKVFVIQSDPLDNRKTTDAVVVEDIPGSLQRIRQFVAQMDVAPRQVLIEAHVLEIDLKNENRRGVNLDHAMNLAGNSVKLQMNGFANPTAPTAFFAQLNGGNLNGLIECLTVTNHAKTLASPRVLVLNGQRAKILIGEKIGFQTTTVTQTSTQQNVSFLNVGVVFECTPRITPDNRILMKVKPEVSTGQINVETKLPQTKSTEVETNILLDDGQGIVIGGLIQEKDINQQNKLPYLADIKYIGALFQRRQTLKQRSEVVIAILPRIVPYDPAYQQQACFDALRTQTPLLNGCLQTNPRPYEGSLPDCVSNPQAVRLPACVRPRHKKNCQCQECLNCEPEQFGPQPTPAYPGLESQQSDYFEPNSTGSRPAAPMVPQASYGKQNHSAPRSGNTGVVREALIPPPPANTYR